MNRDACFTIAQFSDIHCGDPRFDEALMENVLRAVNASQPDLVLIPGDLTASGYRDQFEAAKGFIAGLECEHVIVLSGNHDERKVGYVHFDDLFGTRHGAWRFPFGIACEGRSHAELLVVAVESAKPDLDDGELGRHRQGWLDDQLQVDGAYKIVAMHHHLVSIPGTGRERNIVWDAGDVLEILARNGVDLVVAGHKHVPYVWPVADMLVSTSGTATTWRTRGYTPPSWSLIRITADETRVDITDSSDGHVRSLRFPRQPKRTPSAATSTPESHSQ